MAATMRMVTQFSADLDYRQYKPLRRVAAAGRLVTHTADGVRAGAVRHTLSITDAR